MPKRVTPRGEAAPKQASARKPAAKKTTAAKKQTEKASTYSYLRNIRYVEARLTLEDNRRINLQPRGQRGDMARIPTEDLGDTVVQDNVGYIIEVISDEAGREIMRKQQTNQNTSQSVMSQLTNERGEPYTQESVTVGPSNEEQAIVVADVQNTGQGRFSERNTELVRSVGPNIVNAPGSIQIPDNIPAHERADWVARNVKGDQTGDALLGELNVTVEPTQQG